MAINTERLYENAKEALRLACISVHDGDIENGEALYKMMLKDPELYLRASDRYAWNNALPALEIFAMAKDALGKAKGGTAYSAVKRFIKGCSDQRPDFKGVWYDADDRQCMCDGYHVLRLKNHVEGFNTVKGMDLDKCYPKDYELVAELPMPTPGELKINKKKFESWRGAPCYYDFGEDLPRVNANYLKNIMDCLPDAKAYVTDHPLTGPIIFKSDKGDALLLPVRKKTA